MIGGFDDFERKSEGLRIIIRDEIKILTQPFLENPSNCQIFLNVTADLLKAMMSATQLKWPVQDYLEASMAMTMGHEKSVQNAGIPHHSTCSQKS